MRIGVDIDGVLNDLSRFHLECGLRFCQQHQLSCRVDPSVYEIRDMFRWAEGDYRRFQKEYYKLFFLTCAYLRPLAAEAVRMLRQRSEVYIITGRKPSLMHALDIVLPKTSVSDLSQRWLAQAGIEYDRFILTSWDKRDALLWHKIDVMIEDSPLFFGQAADLPATRLLCFDAAYNQNVISPAVQRVYNWHDVLQLI